METHCVWNDCRNVVVFTNENVRWGSIEHDDGVHEKEVRYHHSHSDLNYNSEIILLGKRTIKFL